MRQSLKEQWKRFSDFYSKLSSLVLLYARFAEIVEGDTKKARKIMQVYPRLDFTDCYRTYEKKHEEGEFWDDPTTRDCGAGVLRVTAELVSNLMSAMKL